MPPPQYQHRILATARSKVISATKYLGVPLALCLVFSLRLPCLAADEVDISEPTESSSSGPATVAPLPEPPSPAEPSSAPPTPPEPPANLTITDCGKCHPTVVSALRANGKAHRDKLTCLDCHIGHPPRVKDIIPACSRCHKGAAHFGLTNCLECHTNPHTPLQITLTRTITAPCTTCHNGQLEQLQEHRSIHSTLDCTACHTSHGYRPPCFNCHRPHLEGMANATCQHCHKPHMPLEVYFPEDTPSEYCAPCHPKVYALLANSRAKHRNVLCAKCHATKHKTIPVCQKCHESPHSPTIINQFSSCGKCHGIAHDLKLNRIDMRLENQPR